MVGIIELIKLPPPPPYTPPYNHNDNRDNSNYSSLIVEDSETDSAFEEDTYTDEQYDFDDYYVDDNYVDEITDDNSSLIIIEDSEDEKVDSVFGELVDTTEQNIQTDTDLNIKSVEHISNFRGCVTNVTANSQRLSETYGNNTYYYHPFQVIDNDMSTCWCEGDSEYGVGDYITLNFDDTYEMSELCLWNGLCTNKNLFYKNSRIHTFTLVLSNGDTYDYVCADGWDNRKNTFSFDNSVETSSLKIIIKSVYEGEKYKDTCLSEIDVL